MLQAHGVLQMMIMLMHLVHGEAPMILTLTKAETGDLREINIWIIREGGDFDTIA